MANTPAGPKVTGAVSIFPYVGPNKTPLFLGYGREPPKIQTEYGWMPFFNDQGGPIIPLDELFAGEEATVSVTLNWWRSDTLGLVESVIPVQLGGLPNFLPFGSIGSMALFEGLAYPLALVFPYGVLKSVYKAAGMPAGVRLLAAKLQGPVLYSPGNKPFEINLVWKCKCVLAANGSLTLADRVLTGLPAAA